MARAIVPPAHTVGPPKDGDDEATAHILPEAERTALRAGRGAQPLPVEAWTPFGPTDLALWVGPNLAVATRDRRGEWRVVARGEARALLLEHAFRVPASLERAIRDAVKTVPLGTPIGQAVGAFRRVLSGFVVKDLPDSSTTLFVRAPEAVFSVAAGRYRDLEHAGWVRGAEALDLVRRHAGAKPDAGRSDTLIVPVGPTEGRRFLQVLVLAAVVFFAAPVLALPLLLVDAVLWMISIALVWTIGIFLAPGALRRWNSRRPRGMVRVDPWRIWLPNGLGPACVDRGEVGASMSWRKAFGVATTGIGGRGASVRNSAMTYLHLKGPDLDLALCCPGEPPARANVPLAPEAWRADARADITHDDLWRLASELIPERIRTRAALCAAPGQRPEG